MCTLSGDSGWLFINLRRLKQVLVMMLYHLKTRRCVNTRRKLKNVDILISPFLPYKVT